MGTNKTRFYEDPYRKTVEDDMRRGSRGVGDSTRYTSVRWYSIAANTWGEKSVRFNNNVITRNAFVSHVRRLASLTIFESELILQNRYSQNIESQRRTHKSYGILNQNMLVVIQ